VVSLFWCFPVSQPASTDDKSRHYEHDEREQAETAEQVPAESEKSAVAKVPAWEAIEVKRLEVSEVHFHFDFPFWCGFFVVFSRARSAEIP